MPTLNPKRCNWMQREHTLEDLIYRNKLIGSGMYCRHCNIRVKTEADK